MFYSFFALIFLVLSLGARAEESRQAAFDTRQAALDQRAAELDYRYAFEQHHCYSRFFVNYCLNKARAKMRADSAALRSDQLTLEREVRALRAQQYAEHLAQRQAQEAAALPQRKVQERFNQARYDDKQAEQRRKLEQARLQSARSAQHVARYNAKQRAANQRKALRSAPQ
ncbi:hypothetical protein [Mycoavidus sp. B2-EB]|uniref:hypothetical protein n=1 Tax=Mycoavidus sp. B2-EB TaxID=2651972 RepID=UPI0016286FA7|nr:hypothetical protein [Mycoavidus sp. B2-EB]BBO59473.1 hypothetical protein MPB2EB_0592 [Mycoavidus sp. B2-EB]